MSAPTNAECLKSLIDFVEASVISLGLDFPAVVWRDADKGTIAFELVDLPIDQVGGLFYHVVNTTTQEPKCAYLCIALDMNSAPGQGLEFSEFVLVGEYDPTRAPTGAKHYRDRWRWGVINYDRGAKIIRPIDWQNEYWKEAGHRLRASFGPPCYVWVRTNPGDLTTPPRPA